MGLLSIFKSPIPAPRIDDKAKVHKLYRHWRIRTFYSMYIGYVFYYLTRKSFTFAMPAMAKDLGMSMADLGKMGSILAISYGISKFLSGILADRSNPRYFMAVGLILTGVFNIFFGLSSSLWLLMVLWALNGWFQGFGWPPCARYLTHWYSQKERGSWWGTWSTAHSVGGFLIPVIAAYAAHHYNWRYAMFIPGVMAILMGFFLINRLRDTPRSLGLPPIEEYKNDFPSGRKEKSESERLPVKEILFKYVLNNKYIWALAISYFFVYAIRSAINDWSQLYLIREKGFEEKSAGFCVGLFEVGGIFGSLLAGWMSDRTFSGKRAPINIFFLVGIIFAIGFFWLVPFHSVWVGAGFTFLIGFLVFGPQMLIGMATAELSHQDAAGTATGFIGWVAYLGAASAGYPLGKAIDLFGWPCFFAIVTLCGVISTLVLFPLWNVKAYDDKDQNSPQKDGSDPSTAK